MKTLFSTLDLPAMSIQDSGIKKKVRNDSLFPIIKCDFVFVGFLFLLGSGKGCGL